jgi:hypothetical protein
MDLTGKYLVHILEIMEDELYVLSHLEDVIFCLVYDPNISAKSMKAIRVSTIDEHYVVVNRKPHWLNNLYRLTQ